MRDKNTEDYLPIAAIEKALGAAGIDPAREIIVYGDRGLPSTYFAHLTLRYFGATNARVFHDGIDAWRAAGQPVSTTPTKARPVTLKLTPRPGVIADSKEVVAALKRPDVQFLDVRTVKEFKGEDVRAIRGGHIPGAINIPFEQNWVDPDTRNKLRSGAVKDNAGPVAEAPRGTGQGVREAGPGQGNHRLLPERQPRRRDALWCWRTWASRTSRSMTRPGSDTPAGSRAPAEDEVWTNFGSLPVTVRGLENRFGELERQRVAR